MIKARKEPKHSLPKTVAEDLLCFVTFPDELSRLNLLRLALRSYHRGGGAISGGGGGISERFIGEISTGFRSGWIVNPDPTHS